MDVVSRSPPHPRPLPRPRLLKKSGDSGRLAATLEALRRGKAVGLDDRNDWQVQPPDFFSSLRRGGEGRAANSIQA